jgi:uncharacterized protein YktA (UPF0223 family)
VGTAALIATFCVWFFVEKIEIRDIVTVFTSGIVSTTLIYHSLNYNLNYETNKIKFEFDETKLAIDRKIHATNLIGEWHKKDMTDNIVRVRKLMDTVKSGKLNAVQIDEKIEIDTETRIALVSILNYFERICLSIDEGVSDNDILKSYFRFIFRVYWGSFQEFVYYRRKQRDDMSIFCDFEKYIVTVWK